MSVAHCSHTHRRPRRWRSPPRPPEIIHSHDRRLEVPRRTAHPLSIPQPNLLQELGVRPSKAGSLGLASATRKGLPLCVRGRRRGLRDQSSELARLGPSQVPGPPARLEYEPTELVPLGLCERGPAGLQQQPKLRCDPTMVGVRHSCRVNPAPDRPPGAREPARAGRPSPGSAPEPSSAAYAAYRPSYSATPGASSCNRARIP